MNVIVPQHKTKLVFDFFQRECFFLFLSKKNLCFRWLDQKREENVEKKSGKSKKKKVSQEVMKKAGAENVTLKREHY